MARVVLYQGTQQRLQLLGLQQDTGTPAAPNLVPVNNATVVANMTNLDGTSIPEITNLTLPNADTAGDYQATIAATFNPRQSDRYICVITVTVGGTLVKTIYANVSVEQATS